MPVVRIDEGPGTEAIERRSFTSVSQAMSYMDTIRAHWAKQADATPGHYDHVTGDSRQGYTFTRVDPDEEEDVILGRVLLEN